VRLLLVVVLLVLCTVVLCDDSPPELPSDPALDKLVTLALKGEAISDVVKLLTKQTGVRFKTSKEVSDQKVTIFVDEKPLKEVMEGITTLFQWQWHVGADDEGTVYGLYDPYREKREENKRKCLEEAQKLLLSELARMAVNPEKTEAELDQPPADWQADIADNPIIQSEPEILETIKKMAVRMERDKYPLLVPCLRVYNTLSPNLRQLLVEGYEICFSSESPEPEWKISDDILKQLESGIRVVNKMEEEFQRQLEMEMQQTQSDPPTPQPGWNEEYIEGEEWDFEDFEGWEENSIHIFDEPDYENLILKNVSITFSSNVKTSTIETKASLGFCWTDGTDENTLYEGRDIDLFTVCLQEEPVTEVDHLPKKDDDQILDTKVSINLDDLENENLPTYSQFWIDDEPEPKLVNKSDILSILHHKLGIQIISDHYSEYGLDYAVNVWQEMPIKQLLSSGLRDIGVDTYWGWDGNYLYTRWKNVREMDAAEIPNRLLRPWQAAVKRQGYLDIDDLSEIVMLTEPQMDNLMDCSAAFGFDMKNIQMAFNHGVFLKFYGALTSRHRHEMSTMQLMTMGLNSKELAALSEYMKEHYGFCLEGVRVGVYKDGVRVDKPMADPLIKLPTAIEMRRRDYVPVYEYCVATSETSREIGQVYADTYEEALVEFRMMHPKASPDCLTVKNCLQYEVNYYFDDLSSSSLNIDIPLPDDKKSRRK